MAVISLVSDQVAAGVYKYTWETMEDDDTGAPLRCSGLADKTVTVTGTYGSATVTIEGSNDGTNWINLTDATDNALSFTVSNQISVITENPLQIRPQTAGGTGTDIDVIIIARRYNNG